MENKIEVSKIHEQKIHNRNPSKNAIKIIRKYNPKVKTIDKINKFLKTNINIKANTINIYKYYEAHHQTQMEGAKESNRRSYTLPKNNISKIKDNINENILIPLLNREKENNCFLNVEIQIMFNLIGFRNEFFQKNDTLKK